MTHSVHVIPCDAEPPIRNDEAQKFIEMARYWRVAWSICNSLERVLETDLSDVEREMVQKSFDDMDVQRVLIMKKMLDSVP